MSDDTHRRKPRRRSEGLETRLGHYVRQRRQELGLTQAELATITARHLRDAGLTSGVDRHLISGVERGRLSLSTRKAEPIARALGQALDGEPWRLLRLAGHLPGQHLSVAAVIATDPRITDAQRLTVARLYAEWGVDVDEPIPNM